MSFRPHPFAYRRRPTREVRIGDVGVGGANPIRVQSMTTPATTDTDATVEQAVRLVEAGCEIVRVTVPTSADAASLPAIRAGLRDRGIRVPLVADIHFTPAVAMKAVEHVEKIRVNPGNFADKKRFAVREYSDAEYDAELERIEGKFSPLVSRCRELGVAMRIGTNHGSLSDRIMNRYGDTPLGMVESALEFVRICERHDYRDLVLSMKASNPIVVLQAYRLLVDRMDRENMDYPLHLGVTEAGDGEDARIKSALGIGVLLEEGLGDTIRVSLTEDPVAEIPVCRALVAPFNAVPRGAVRGPGDDGGLDWDTPLDARPERRRTRTVRIGPRRVGSSHPVLVETALAGSPSDGGEMRAELDAQAGPRVPADTRAELVSVTVRSRDDVRHVADLKEALDALAPRLALSARIAPDAAGLDPSNAAAAEELATAAHRVHVTVRTLDERTREGVAELLERCADVGTAVLVELEPIERDAGIAAALGASAVRLAERRGLRDLMLAVSPRVEPSPLLATRMLAARLERDGLDVPVVLVDRPGDRDADPLLGPAVGGLLCDGVGDAVHPDVAPAQASRRAAFDILQAARVRITKTEFISCPSCGRTLFDLETTTARIKKRTAHLKGVKIAIMGCVVNGPGEMADADFGYVGWGEGKIALFVGKEMVEKDIPSEHADERLVELIKRHGRWVEPSASSPAST